MADNANHEFIVSNSIQVFDQHACCLNVASLFANLEHPIFLKQETQPLNKGFIVYMSKEWMTMNINSITRHRVEPSLAGCRSIINPSRTDRLCGRTTIPLRVKNLSNRSSCQQCMASAGQEGRKKQQTFSSFDDLLQQKPIVLVDFYATWCGPCQMMSKVMSECSTVVKDVAFVKVNTEKYPNIATRYQVQALPTLVLFKHGSAVARVEGALSASQLRQWILQNVS